VIAYWTHLRELRRLRGACLVAAADPDMAAREQARQLTRIPVHADPLDLLARSDVDAVVVCTPSHLHADLGIAAARAGKHIYLEKPVATTAADARRLSEAVRESGIRTAVGFNRRCHPLYLQARDLINSGAVGAIRAVITSCNEPLTPDAMPGWKRARATGGGVLLDLASHHADQLRWFLNDEADQVEAEIHSRATEDDEACVRITMRGGVCVQSYFSFRAGRADFLEFIGQRGTLRVDRHCPSLSLRLARRFGYGVRRAQLLPTREVIAWRVARLARPSYESSYRAALADFTQAIRGGMQRGAGLDDGLRSLEIVLAAEDSARTRRPAVPSLGSC
jgi:myo-inositol 2-dehydrogenase/D-chiro-inositol 1-dehydrogenase